MTKLNELIASAPLSNPENWSSSVVEMITNFAKMEGNHEQ